MALTPAGERRSQRRMQWLHGELTGDGGIVLWVIRHIMGNVAAVAELVLTTATSASFCILSSRRQVSRAVCQPEKNIETVKSVVHITHLMSSHLI